MNTLNIIGTITRDIEIKYLSGGTAVAKFGIAWNDKVKNHQGGYDDKAHFFEVFSFGKTAENINQYFHKGKQIGITGALNFEQWQSQDGQNRSKVSIKLEKFDFIGKSDTPQQGQYNQNGSYNQNYDSQMQGANARPAPGYENRSGGQTYQDGMNQQPAMGGDIPTIDIDEDSIPF